MRVLIIRLGSMGDIIHALPALTDAGRALPEVRFDWAVDESFAAVPAWHPLVERTLCAALRRRAGQGASGGGTLSDWLQLHRQLNERRYDAVVDLQGNLKSALATVLASGPAHGPDHRSCREQPAFAAYRHRHPVARGGHAIERTRQLMARALGYDAPGTRADYGAPLPDDDSRGLAPARPWLFLAHNASWATKLWPLAHWRALALRAAQSGLAVLLPCGDAAEARRAGAIARGIEAARLLPPRLSLDATASLIGRAAGVVGNDTGFAQMAAMAGVPAVTLYGPTAPWRIGTLGHRQRHLCAPLSCTGCTRHRCRHGKGNAPACMGQITPECVWQSLDAARRQPQQGRPAVFLDRDGVINADHGYVSREDDFHLLAPVLEACRRMRGLGYALVVVTNQSGIARGLYSERDYLRLTDSMRRRFRAADAPLDGVYHCPHAPDAGCACRKPQAGMLHRAAADLDLDLSRSVMVGDKVSDLLAARAAGLHRAYLVRSGQPLDKTARGRADAVLGDLGELPDHLQPVAQPDALWYPAGQNASRNPR